MADARAVGLRQRVLGRFVRIYESRDRYGTEPRTPPPEPELSLPDFPRAGAAIRVYFGCVPAELVSGLHHRQVIAAVFLQTLFGQRSVPSFDEEVERMLEKQQPPTFEDADWYVTLTADMPLDIAVLDGPRYQWVDIRETEVDDAFREESSATLDAVAAVLGDVLGRGYLNRRVIPDFTLYMLPGRTPCLVPRLSGSGTATVGRGMESFPADALTGRLEALRNLPAADLGSLQRAMSWLHAGMLTEDPWRRFQSAWFALELITHRLSRLYRPRVVDRLSGVGGPPVLPSQIVEAMLWEPKRMPLAARFAIAASYLSPDTVEADVLEFRRLKQVRDAMSHGSVADTDALPTAAVEELAGRYLRLALQAISRGDS